MYLQTRIWQNKDGSPICTEECVKKVHLGAVVNFNCGGEARHGVGWVFPFILPFSKSIYGARTQNLQICSCINLRSPTKKYGRNLLLNLNDIEYLIVRLITTFRGANLDSTIWHNMVAHLWGHSHEQTHILFMYS